MVDAKVARIRRPGRIIGWCVVVGALVGVFEAVLYMAALLSFSHLDSPECAGSNTFCSPDGVGGPTGGSIVVLVGNAVALVLTVTALAIARHRRAGTGRRPRR